MDRPRAENELNRHKRSKKKKKEDDEEEEEVT